MIQEALYNGNIDATSQDCCIPGHDVPVQSYLGYGVRMVRNRDDGYSLGIDSGFLKELYESNVITGSYNLIDSLLDKIDEFDCGKGLENIFFDNRFDNKNGYPDAYLIDEFRSCIGSHLNELCLLDAFYRTCPLFVGVAGIMAVNYAVQQINMYSGSDMLKYASAAAITAIALYGMHKIRSFFQEVADIGNKRRSIPLLMKIRDII